VGDTFKFKTIADEEKVYIAQKVEWRTKEYYVLLWEEDSKEEHDTGIGSYVWEMDEVKECINDGTWYLVE
jgi:hypothetical protein